VSELANVLFCALAFFIFLSLCSKNSFVILSSVLSSYNER
jgi:hypothetical protein